MEEKPTYAQKMRQANREARATVVALAVVVVAWAALGFGVAATGAEAFHTPLWIVTGTVGTWVVAIVVAVFMSRRVITDVDLDDEGGEDGASGTGAPGPSEAGGSHE